MSGRLSCWRWCLGVVFLALASQWALAVNPSTSKKDEVVTKRFTKTYHNNDKKETWSVTAPRRVPVEGGEVEIITTIQRPSEAFEVRRYRFSIPGSCFGRGAREFNGTALVNFEVSSDFSLSGEATASDTVSGRASHRFRLHTRTAQQAGTYWAGILFGMPMLDADQIPFLSGKQISANNDGTFTHRVASGNEAEQNLILTLSESNNGGLELVRIEAEGEWTLQSISDNSQGGAAGENSGQTPFEEQFSEEGPLIQDDDENIHSGYCCWCFDSKEPKE
ncbi:hypothetical protein [Endozoicomonas euniceicola]|uniref:Uncharacterized protein n=1 Tax=Endozoicomonas euniceicola TaxID=1234143 RepID=A0ABY6GX65_9GAMM|nr:hypothetical protein [Endozoicomonas euniceicola]UYM16564.1 hypothetical protein NX720_01095 [Endozoicomonas euniceicola]